MERLPKGALSSAHGRFFHPSWLKQLWTSLHHGSQDTSWWFQPGSQKGIISGVVEHPWHFYGRFKCRDSPSYLANLLTGSLSSKWYTLAHPKNPIMCGSSLSFRTQQRHSRNALMVRCCPCVLTLYFFREQKHIKWQQQHLWPNDDMTHPPNSLQ